MGPMTAPAIHAWEEEDAVADEFAAVVSLAVVANLVVCSVLVAVGTGTELESPTRSLAST